MVTRGSISCRAVLLFVLTVAASSVGVSTAWQQQHRQDAALLFRRCGHQRDVGLLRHNSKLGSSFLLKKEKVCRCTTSRTTTKSPTSSFSSSSWPLFATTSTDPTTTTTLLSLEQRKAELLQLGACMDRGQAYNPTSGEYYADRMELAKEKIEALLRSSNPDSIPSTLKDVKGEWELVFSTVRHGIFRSSPFFLAIQESYELYAEEKEAFGQPKADLFFKLHELQTCSWGVSKIGRVAQFITDDYLYSEFDTSIFSLTVIPILGWFKLLPTFGGSVVTAAKITGATSTTAQAADGGDGGYGGDGLLVKMTVDYTTSRKVPGLTGLGEWIWKIRVPVGAIWKLLPWNEGREATCRILIRYCDQDFRIAQDTSGDYFVYCRPVAPRPLDLATK